jgi:tRNA threonylcarbamoyladenosine biosynthesis protein TsaB
MALILNIDTSTKNLYISIAENGACVDFFHDSEIQNHTNLLHLKVGELLSKNKLQFTHISAVALMNGPGSYTGLRIGLSAAKGFCFALNIPLIAISNIDILGDHYLNNSDVKHEKWICGISPMAEEFIFNEYSFDKLITYHNIDTINSLLDKKKCLNKIVGQLLSHGKDNLLQSVAIEHYTDIHYINKYSFCKYQKNEFESLVDLNPFYVKNTYVKSSKKL